MNPERRNSPAQLGPQLGKVVKTRQFFVIGFGSIVGVGWIIVMGDWLSLAGPLGALLAFAGGALVIMLVGICYAEMATMIPVSGGEIAYVYEIFGVKACYAMGWFLALGSISFISFEAISVGWIAGTIFPAIKGITLYTARGDLVQSGTLLLGIGGIALLTYVNYRGLKAAAIFQEIFVYGFIIITCIFVFAGLIWGKTNNLVPCFSKTGLGPVLKGILAVFIMTPAFYSGFNVIPQTMEEKAARTSLKKAGKVILFSIGAAAVFYLLVILSTSMAMPWKRLINLEFPVAGAFETAFNSRAMSRIVLLAGLLGIINIWNTTIISSSRIIFALGRARIIPPIFGKIHGVYRSPFVSVLFAGAVGCIGILLGRSALIPIVNVTSACNALAWTFSCLAVVKLRRRHPNLNRPYRVPGGIGTASLGVLSCVFIVFLTLYEPFVSSKAKFPMEWAIILAWGLLGFLFWILARRIRAQLGEAERRQLILGGDSLLENGSILDREG